MTANPWMVSITTLRRTTGSRRREHRIGRVGELRVAESWVPGDADVEAAVELDALDGGIEVTGEVDAPWQGECRRCLKPISGELRCEVRELYRPRAPGEAPDADEETYALGREMLDLAPLVRDAILLELPIAPVCRDDCRGICPVCGADLNDGPCDCSPQAADPRWAVLDALRSEGADTPSDPRV